MVDRELIHDRMLVRCADGERLGTVDGIGEVHFLVEQGLVNVRDYLVRFDDVASIAGRNILLDRRREDLAQVDWDDGGCVPPRHAADLLIDTEPGFMHPPG